MFCLATEAPIESTEKQFVYAASPSDRHLGAK